LKEEEIEELLNTELPERILKDLVEPEMVKEEEQLMITEEEEQMLGKEPFDEEEEDLPEIEVNQGINKLELLDGETVMVSQPPVAVMVSQAPVEMKMMATNTIQDQPLQQGGSITNQQYMLMPVSPTIQPMQIVQAQIPNAPPTLVVDTSAEAMEAGGFSNNDLPTIRSILKGGSKQSGSSSPSSKINKFSTFSVNKLGDGGNDNSSSFSNNGRINIVKEGQ
jgi:hypothetical protein